MAVLFPTQFGQVLKPEKPAELLQGFLNIQTAENSQNGLLTKAQLDSYSQKQFFAIDSSSSVAGYLRGNFAAIAAIDGNATSISTDDLVQLRQGLPPVLSEPLVPPTQPPTAPPVQAPVLTLFFQFMQMIQQLLFSLFR